MGIALLHPVLARIHQYTRAIRSVPGLVVSQHWNNKICHDRQGVGEKKYFVSQ